MSPKTVLITGCTPGGIGAALAVEYHRRGLHVFATARNTDKLWPLVKECTPNSTPERFEILQLDVQKEDSIKAAVERVKEVTGGTLDILVNNSGIGYNATILDSETDKVREIFDINVFGLIRTIQLFSPLLICSRGQIINIGSAVVPVPIPFQGVYNASKGAVHTLSDTLRIELQPLGITVIYVITGGIQSNFFNNVKQVHFPPDSPYDPVRKELTPHMVAEQLLNTTVTQYARAVVGNSLAWRPKKIQWCGSGTWSAWGASTFLWRGINDYVLSGMFGLTAVTKKLMQASTQTLNGHPGGYRD